MYVQKAVIVLFTDELCIWCRQLRQHCRLWNLSVGCYGAAFNYVSILLMRDVTVVLTLMDGEVNNVSLREQ